MQFDSFCQMQSMFMDWQCLEIQLNLYNLSVKHKHTILLSRRNPPMFTDWDVLTYIGIMLGLI